MLNEIPNWPALMCSGEVIGHQTEDLELWYSYCADCTAERDFSPLPSPHIKDKKYE